MSSKQAAATAPGVQLQIGNDLTGTPQAVTDPTGAPSALQLSTNNAVASHLGIGMTPQYPLHVGSDQLVRVEGSSDGSMSGGVSLGGHAFFYVDALNVTGGRFVVTNSGNVGINQPNPQATLDVNGQINATALNVNPQGAGSIVIGNPSTNTGGFTSLILGISAESGGNAQIQSISQSGTTWGALLLNPKSGTVGINQPNPNPQFALDVNGAINAAGLNLSGQVAVAGMQPESAAPSSSTLQTVYIDPSTGILYYHN